MSSTSCGCECQAIDVVTVHSHAVSFDLVDDAPPQGSLLPVVLLLSMVTVALTLARQRRRYSSLTSLKEGDSVRANPVVHVEWRLRLSPGERRLLSYASLHIQNLGAAAAGWLRTAFHRPAQGATAPGL
jgi:hypothetical protein